MSTQVKTFIQYSVAYPTETIPPDCSESEKEEVKASLSTELFTTRVSKERVETLEDTGYSGKDEAIYRTITQASECPIESVDSALEITPLLRDVFVVEHNGEITL